MKAQKGVFMKKILFVILFSMFIIPVSAQELPDITDDIEIRTKWYREEEVGKYHPKGEELPGYTENPDKVTYSTIGSYSSANCLLPTEYYNFYVINLKKYKIVNKTKYIKFTNFKYDNNITVLLNRVKINFEVISNKDDELIIGFSKSLETEKLTLFADYSGSYNVTMYLDEDLTQVTVSKDIVDAKILIPDRTWITSETTYYTTSSETAYENNDLVTYLGNNDTCRAIRINTYRYKIEKHYYDNEYHTYVENYLPDMTDIKVYYKGEELVKTVEVPVYEKITEYITEYITKYQTIEVPKEIIKTIEINKEPTNTENEIKECPPEVITEVTYVDKIKKITTIPKKIYILIFSMITIIFILIAWLIKKYVTR